MYTKNPNIIVAKMMLVCDTETLVPVRGTGTRAILHSYALKDAISRTWVFYAYHVCDKQ
jgi:hypothetical protein